LLEHEAENVIRPASALRGQFDYLVVAARGTSDNAARYAMYLFGAHNQLSVALAGENARLAQLKQLPDLL
jgi:glucosamine--fructose-6-phosphate aminotransferase (isomerizing)